ncbi:patatin-like phospholipase family protein [Micromonospora sp. NPDC005710]|uniref:patatin-like phospholipase family protein n=1 Tax=Micromonospora sp. NPDC005710 TaxID=3157051 RepID=UPI0034072FD9
MISVAIQGGAMRSIYCLGAVRALVDKGLAPEVRSIHATSAGCVAGAVLAAKIATPEGLSVAEMGDLLLRELQGNRFINLWRLRRIVDVNHLVDVIVKVTHVAPETFGDGGFTFEVALTDAKSGTAFYLDLSSARTADEVYQALVGTMAVPILYPPRVRIGGRRYLDGGITDPLPALRALRKNPQTLIAISSVAKSNLGRELEGRESLVVQLLPVLPPQIRHLLLTRNPLGAAVEDLMDATQVGGVRLVRIAPLDQSRLGHRLETDRSKLAVLEEMGYADAMSALAGLGSEAQGEDATHPTDPDQAATTAQAVSSGS